MIKNKAIRYSIFVFLLCAFLVSGCYIFADSIKTKQILAENTDEESDCTEDIEEIDDEVVADDSVDAEDKIPLEEDAEEADDAEEDTPLPVADNVEMVEGEIPEGFFKKTLFVGDSRTVGLKEYGHLKGATFFADSGMSVYKLKDFKKKIKKLGEVTLEELLSQKQYKRIYFMMGINELGYNKKKTIALYEEWVDTILELQPDAELVICANLHVTKERSDKDKTFNNKNIDKLNKAMAEIAESKDLKYIDANQIFDDKKHNLDESYTNDDCHPIGRYYLNWAIWLANYQSYNSDK